MVEMLEMLETFLTLETFKNKNSVTFLAFLLLSREGEWILLEV
jgi:hypothetical protein